MIKNIITVASFASKDKSSVLSNIIIKDGFATAQNGLVGASLAINSDIDFCCNADKLRMALNNCSDDKLKISNNKNKIVINSGKFKSSIELADIESYPMPAIEYDHHQTQTDIISHIGIVSKFSDQNDVRVALQGVAITGSKLSATNGHMAIIKDIIDTKLDEVIIPTKAIQSLSKPGFDILNIGVKDKTIFFGCDEGFLFSKTIDYKMPDISKIITQMENEQPISEMIDDLKSIAPLCGDSRHVMIGESISTLIGDALFSGYSYDECAFNVDYLLKISDVADMIDLSKYPDACPFSGSGVIGAVVGVRL